MRAAKGCSFHTPLTDWKAMPMLKQVLGRPGEKEKLTLKPAWTLKHSPQPNPDPLVEGGSLTDSKGWSTAFEQSLAGTNFCRNRQFL
jgi:hypothetical protein